MEREEVKTELLDRALGEVVDRLSATESRLETVLAGVSAPLPAAPSPSATEDGGGSGGREMELARVLGAGAALGAVLVGVAQLAFGR